MNDGTTTIKAILSTTTVVLIVRLAAVRFVVVGAENLQKKWK